MNEEKKTNREIYRRLVGIAVPISLQSLVSAGLGLIGNLMVSRLGDAQLSAAGLAGQFLGLYHLCVLGIAMGAAVLTARYYAGGEQQRLQQTVTAMLRALLPMVLLFTALTAGAPRWIMGLYSKEPAVVEYGAVYLRLQLPAYLCVGLTVGCTVVLRSAGQVRVPLYAAMGALGVNWLFCRVLIFGFGPLPAMGIAGASLALLLARLFEFVVICGYFFSKDKAVGYRLRHIMMPCGAVTKKFLRIAGPVLVSNGLLGLGENVAAAILGHMGQTYVAANAVASVMQLMSGVLTQGIAHGSGILIGHAMGRGSQASARKQARQFVGLSTWVGIAAAALIMLLRDVVIGFYGVSAETAEVARQLMGAMALIVLFQSPGTTLSKGVLRAGGDTVFLMVTDGVLQWLLAAPLGVLAGAVWKLPVVWVYLLLRSDQVLRYLICLLRLRGEKWMKSLGGNA